MSLNRFALKKITELLAESYSYIENAIGDTNKNPAIMLDAETMLCRSRGATLFHDSDYASGYFSFKEKDRVELGFQGSFLKASISQIQDFPSLSGSASWNPSYYGAPSPEGWFVHYYNGYSAYRIPNYIDSRNNGQYEMDATQRVSYSYPVAFRNNAYTRVPFWENSRYLSIQNTTNAPLTSSSEVVVTISSLDFIGVKKYNSQTDLPDDIRLFTLPQLVQNGNASTNNWTAINLPQNGTALQEVGFKITHGALPNTYDLHINVPQNLSTWATNSYWHIILYWGSLDSFATANPSPYQTGLPSIPLSPYLWNRKNFFVSQFSDSFGWENHGINDLNTYIVADNRTHFVKEDGQYSVFTSPIKYVINTDWMGKDIFSDVNFPYFIDKYSAIPITLAVKSLNSTTDNEVFIGPLITPEFIPDEWENCPYFPPIPEDYIEIGRVILKRSSDSTYNTVVKSVSNYYQNVLVKNNLEIAWMKQSIKTFALPPMGDSNLSSIIMPSLMNTLNNLRQLSLSSAVLDTAFKLIVPSVGVPSYIASSRNDVSDKNSLGSKVFHGLLKSPFEKELYPQNGEAFAITFSPKGIKLIEDMAASAPSTEFVKLEADNFYLTNNSISLPNSLEIYQEYSDSCSSADDSLQAGNRLGLDYTFRLGLEDSDENILYKDWYIMASKFFVTQEEYEIQNKNGSTAGYFTQDTLNSIDQYRLYGIAGLVPDLSQGNSVILNTRVVSPPDATRLTYAQFVAQHAGLSAAALQDALANYMFDNPEGFYQENLSQYSNLFLKIRTASLSVTQYAYGLTPYWQENIPTGEGNIVTGNPYSDSFIIAKSGLKSGDLEISNAVFYGSFNRSGEGGLPQKNDLRQFSGVYIVNGTWAYSSERFSQPISLTIYPKSVKINNIWTYIPFKHDINIVIRLVVAKEIVDYYFTLLSGSNTPVSIDQICSGISFINVSSSMSTLQTTTHGAPPGDLISIRSS